MSEIRTQVEAVLSREPRVIIVYAETGDGKVVTMAAGSQIELIVLEEEGRKALAAMFEKARAA